MLPGRVQIVRKQMLFEGYKRPWDPTYRSLSDSWPLYLQTEQSSVCGATMERSTFYLFNHYNYNNFDYRKNMYVYTILLKGIN